MVKLDFSGGYNDYICGKREPVLVGREMYRRHYVAERAHPEYKTQVRLAGFFIAAA